MPKQKSSFTKTNGPKQMFPNPFILEVFCSSPGVLTSRSLSKLLILWKKTSFLNCLYYLYKCFIVLFHLHSKQQQITSEIKLMKRYNCAMVYP